MMTEIIASDIPCTCQEPPAVRLATTKDGYQEQSVLMENLRRNGWSPIIVGAALSCPPPCREQILDCFQGDDSFAKLCLSCSSSIIYRSAESGAKGASIAEPKESLEVQLSNCSSLEIRQEQNSKQKALIHSWCHSLSQIAKLVCDALQLPSNALLAEIPKESLDLMRVFYYHATSQKAMGSSPHTDWGSWTILWQDSVGGLETYCRACQKWIPVTPPTPSEKNEWQCIVHVGDMASLALNNNNNNNNASCVCWPSPKHRVVSSKEERVSLVYFGYPPANSSITDIQNALADWNVSRRGRRLPLNEYYLLHNQSTSSNDDDSMGTSVSIYRSIQSMPTKQVIQEKWNQVQRSL